MNRKFGEQQRFMLLLIAPAATLMVLFQVVPIVIGANASFRDWALNDPKKTWVGLKHYVAVLTDGAFLQVVLPNTFVFMALSVSLALAAGLGLALLLNRPFRGQKLVQTVLLLPLMVAPVVAAIMLRWMFNDQFGIVNVRSRPDRHRRPVLVHPALERVRDHLAHRRLVVDAVVHAAAARRACKACRRSRSRPPPSTGPAAGACSAISTVPMLRPVIVVCVVIRSIDAFRTFDIVWTLTGGGPARSTELVSQYAYVSAFLNLDFGRGSAAAIIAALIILVLGIVLYRFLDRVVQVSR